MKIAVIQHRYRENPLADADALADASRAAADAGAEAVFICAALPVDFEDAQKRYASAVSGLPGTRLLPRISSGVRAQVFPVTDQIPVIGERLGSAALLYGDACFQADVLSGLAAEAPSVLIMAPMSENELQAEAVLELAIGLSESVAPLVVVADPVGAELGDAGHGGSAVILLGKVLAEALGDEGELLIAEVPEPVPHPDPPEPVPAVPTILAQRLATHEGRKLDLGYLADLSNGVEADRR